MYYLRKLSKPSSLNKLRVANSVEEIPADFIGQDMRTTNNTLSLWRMQTLDSDEIIHALNAALFTCSHIVDTHFLILDLETITKVGLTVDDTEIGKTAYKGVSHLHTNICNLTYGAIGNVLKILCDASKKPDRTIKVAKAEFKERIRSANEIGAIDFSALQETMQNEIAKVIGKT